MTSTVIFNKFKAPSLWKNRFTRSEYELWDANIHHGDVRPFACPEQICQDSWEDIYSLAECDCTGFNTRTPIVRGFCSEQYFLIVGGTLMQMTPTGLCAGDSMTIRAGAPVPEAPFITDSTCPTEDCDITGISYVMTYITEHGGVLTESAPSEPTTPIAVAGDVPNVTIGWNSPPIPISLHNIISIRIYRVETTFEDGTDSISPNGAEFVFVHEVSGSSADTYLDSIPTANTGGPLTTYEPMAFPAPNEGLIALARTTDGIAVADDHRVYISTSGEPQFTFDGVVTIEDTILEMVAIGNTLFVFTDSKPVKIAYRHTDGVMSIDKQIVERRLPLKSLKSVSVYDNKVYFSSTFSLYTWDIGAYGNDIASTLTPLMSPEQWRNIDPNTVTGTAYEYGYIFSAGNIDHSLMVEFAGDRTDTSIPTSIIPISYINPNVMTIDIDGQIIYSDGTGTYIWDWRRVVTDSPVNLYDNLIPPSRGCDCCPWTMKMYFDNEGKNRFSKMRIEWDERSASHLNASFYLKAFGTEELIANFEVISSRGFSTPKFSSSQTVCVEVSGCGIMHEIRLATSNQELVSNSNNLIGNSGEE